MTGVVDPTAEPDPRRWGNVIRGPRTGMRVYWDASLAKLRQHAWVSIDRQHRFLAEEVLADAPVPEPDVRAQLARVEVELSRLRMRVRELEGKSGVEVPHGPNAGAW